MTAPDDNLLERMTAYITKKKRDSTEQVDIFSALQAARGQACANHWFTLARGYQGKRKFDPTVVARECQAILTQHRPVEALSWPGVVFVYCSIVAVVLVTSLIVLSIFGYTVPKEDRGLVGILMSLLAGVSALSGSSTATVNAMIPMPDGAKMTIKLVGTAAATGGTALLFRWIGY